MKDIELVVFDFDQTIINSAPGFDNAFERIKIEIQKFLDANEIEKQVESYSTELRKKIWALDKQGQYNRDLWWNELLIVVEVNDHRFSEAESKKITKIYWETTIESTEFYPDTLEILNYLKPKYKVGLLTDTDGAPGIKQSRLERSGLLEFFDGVMIAGENVPKTKPDPQPFLTLASQLGISPNFTVMVGDKPFTDIKGGKAAGFYTILILREAWEVNPTPDLQISNLIELKSIL